MKELTSDKIKHIAQEITARFSGLEYDTDRAQFEHDVFNYLIKALDVCEE